MLIGTMFRNMVTRCAHDTIADMQSLLSNIDALLITNPTNIRYLTGFVGAAPEEREAYILLTPNQTFLFTNALYLEQAKKTNATVVEISRENSFAKKLAEILTGPGPVKRLGFEENDLTVAEYKKLKTELKGVTLVATQGRVEELRILKREDEIKNIRRAAKLTDQCFDVILSKIKPGVTEGEIAWEIEAFIRARGAQLAFSPIVAFGINSSQPHYQPAESYKLKADSLVLIDFGIKVNGYCSDMTRMVFVGKPKDEWKRAYETVLEAQQAALNYFHLEGVKAHLPGGKADLIARDVIEKAGFPAYPHSLGHGVGLDIHEAPRLTINKDVILKPGMVVTVEPAIYKEGSYGVRIEDLVLLKKDGIEVFTNTPKKRVIL